MPCVNRRRSLRDRVFRTLGPSLIPALLLLTFLPATTMAATVTLEWAEADFARSETGAGAAWVGPSGQAIPETGAPTLPLETVRLALPFATRATAAEVEVVAWEDVDRPRAFALRDPAISSEDGTVQETWFAPEERWKSGSTYPARVASLAGTAVWHGVSYAEVHVYPMRVLADGRVQRATAMTLRVTTEAVDSAGLVVRTVDWPGVRDRDTEVVASILSNPHQLDAALPPRGLTPVAGQRDPKLDGIAGKAPLLPEGPVEYLIVTTPALAGEFQRLADWKTQMGRPAAVVTTDWILANYRNAADVQESIRNFLQRAYAQWGAEYVLLGGDAHILAPRYVRDRFYPTNSFTDIPADIYFAALDGNWNEDADGLYGEPYQDFLNLGDNADLVAEVYLGRAPVGDVTQAATFIDKVIEYESPSGSVEYLGHSLLLSEVLFPADWDGVEPISLDGATYSEDILFDSFIGGGNTMQSWRLYENYTAYFGSLEETKAAALDSLSSGNFGLVNHVGHGFYYNASVGDGNIFVADADLLTNAPNYFTLYALNCSSGAFDFDCLMERFVQNPNGGSVASIGSARAAFPTTADKYQQNYYEEIFVNGNQEIGKAVALSRVQYSANSYIASADRWTHMSYTLLGDPSLRVWREEPTETATTSHPASVPVGTGDQAFQVPTHLGVTVAVSDANGRMVHAETDLGGNVTIDLSDLTTETGSLTVFSSGRNLVPYTGTITVTAAAGPHVVATLDSLDDSAASPSDGDGDGVADSGETVQLFLQLDNNGGSPAASVTATLSIVDAPGATILDDTIATGALANGAQVVPADAFTVQLASTIPDQDLLVFGLEVTDGTDTWTQTLELLVSSPELVVVRTRWDDSTTGNNDGIIQAGENVRIFVEVANFGTAELTTLTGTLTTGSGNVTLVDDTNTWTALGLKDTGEGAGSFEIVESDVGGENWILLTLTDDWGHSWSHWFELRKPLTPPDPATDTTLGPNDIALRVDTQFDPHFLGYRVYRSTSSGGPFSEITASPLVQTGFYHDRGLASLTPYYYYVTAVDSSGVESDPTGVVSASTSPPEQAGGFPIPLGREMAGATAVGNMLGNGTRVAVFGSDFLCAIDANGNELVNGDNDSQTLGPLGGPPAPNDRFTPAGVALVDLDGNGTQEVLGCNWITDELWILQADGSSFPGWPQPISGGAWATPSVGDLDDDGDLEIVVNSTGGRTYVFHHDGTDFLDGDSNPGTVGVFHVRSGENFNRSTATLFDVDGDDTLEIIFGTHFRNGADNFVHALRNDGTDAPGWPRNLGSGGYNVGSISVADMDGDLVEDLVFLCDNDSLYVFQPDGSNKPGFPIPFTSQAANKDSLTPSPGFGDFDDDGDLEMVVVEIIGGSLSRIHIMDHDGTSWPGWPISLPGLSESSPMVGDLNGDEVPDVLFGIGGGGDNDPNTLYAFNADGSDVAGFPITVDGAFKGTPVIVDFNGDGDVDIVWGGFDRKLHVWDMPFPFHGPSSRWTTFQGGNARTGVLSSVIVSAPAATPRPRVELHPNVPNPFNPSTTLRFEIPEGAGNLVPASLVVYDLAGRRIRSLVAGPMAPGQHEAIWNGRDDTGRVVSTGVYFARLEAAGSTRSVKMTLLK